MIHLFAVSADGLIYAVLRFSRNSYSAMALSVCSNFMEQLTIPYYTAWYFFLSILGPRIIFL